MEYTLKSLFNIDNRVDVRDGYLDQEKGHIVAIRFNEYCRCFQYLVETDNGERVWCNETQLKSA